MRRRPDMATKYAPVQNLNVSSWWGSWPQKVPTHRLTTAANFWFGTLSSDDMERTAALSKTRMGSLKADEAQ